MFKYLEMSLTDIIHFHLALRINPDSRFCVITNSCQRISVKYTSAFKKKSRFKLFVSSRFEIWNYFCFGDILFYPLNIFCNCNFYNFIYKALTFIYFSLQFLLIYCNPDQYFNVKRRQYECCVLKTNLTTTYVEYNISISVIENNKRYSLNL